MKIYVYNVISNLYSSLTVEHSNMFHNLAVLCDNMTLLYPHNSHTIMDKGVCTVCFYAVCYLNILHLGQADTSHLCICVCVSICTCMYYMQLCFLSCVCVTKVMMH